MARGNRRMLKREMEVKAFSAVSTFSELTLTNTAKVASETCRKKEEREEKKRPAISSLSVKLTHRTHQSWGATEDESGDRRKVGKLPHDLQFLPPNALHLRLEGWLPCIKLQNLTGDERQRGRCRRYCGAHGKGKGGETVNLMWSTRKPQVVVTV